MASSGWQTILLLGIGLIAQALIAQEPTLPPTDWFTEEDGPKQRMLFNLDSRHPVAR